MKIGRICVIIYALVVFVSSVTACSDNLNKDGTKSLHLQSTENMEHVKPIEDESKAKEIIVHDGNTLESRVLTPDGYKRKDDGDGSLGQFLRDYPLKPYGSKVHLYDGSEKKNQNSQCGVFELPLEAYNLQQCADSVMRVYAEYFWKTGQYDRIAFHYTNGFLAEYTKWREGKRIKVDGNNTYWVSSAKYDDSYECFVKYLKNVFIYAGTMSMNSEAKEINISEAKIGDVFLKSGNPGHVVLIVDMCENEAGKKAFLLAQGYMPAQEFHLLVNERHLDDPWYYEDEIEYPFSTPEYVFEEGSLKTLLY